LALARAEPGVLRAAHSSWQLVVACGPRRSVRASATLWPRTRGIADLVPAGRRRPDRQRLGRPPPRDDGRRLAGARVRIRRHPRNGGRPDGRSEAARRVGRPRGQAELSGPAGSRPDRARGRCRRRRGSGFCHQDKRRGGKAMRKVIAALDNSAAAASVAATAKSLARTFGAGVEAVHVGEDGDRNAAATAAAAALPFHRLEGAAVPARPQAARDGDAVALVVGASRLSSGRSGGSTALEVITSLTRPVVVVPPDVQPAATVKRVLVPLEGTPLTSLAPQGLIELADDAD